MADITPPTISITSTKSALKSGETALITFTLSEVATDFVLSDITVSGGTLSNFSGSGTSYSATFTPMDNSNVTGVISVSNYKFSDPSGNANEDGNDPNNRVSLSIDTAIPTVSISSSKSIFGINETALISFKLSEPSTDFTLSDVSVLGGVLTNFTGSGANYTATFTPKSGVSTSGSITIGANSFSDAGGNFNNLTSAIGVYLNTNPDPIVPKLNWAQLLGGNSSDSARALTTGLDGSIYVCGFTYTSLDGQPNNGGGDAFLTKFNTDGTKVWTRLLGTSAFDFAYALATGTDGSIFVSGGTGGNLDGQVNLGGEDAFVSKFKPDGTKVWTRLTGSNIPSESANGMTIGLDGSVYIGGTANGPIDGQAYVGLGDTFVTKYSPDGAKLWTRLLGANSIESYDSVKSITTGLDGSIYICGFTNGILDGQTSNGFFDAFVTKYNPDGSKVWTKLIGSSSYDTANAITVGIDGAIFVGGYTSGGVFDGIENYSTSGFISKFLPDGTRVWTKLNLYSQINSLKIGQDGGIFAGGNYFGGTSVEGQIVLGGNDAFVTRYETDGTKSWTRILGSTSSDNLYGLTVGMDGSLFLAGDTYSDLYGEKSLGTPVLYSGKGSSGSSSPDAFLMNLSVPDNVPPQISITLAGTSKIGPLKAGESVVINFAITEAVKDFVATDITVQGGTLTNFQGSDKSYSATFTAISELTAQYVSVGSGKFSDAAGNFNLDGADANNTITIAVDTAAPTIALSTSKSSLIAGESAVLTFVLSEISTNFVVSDVNVTGGTLSNWVSYGDTYTALFKPTANSTANGVISVISGVFTDSAGNPNADGSDSNNSVTLSIDTVVPTIALSTSKTNLIAGESATLTFTLSEASTNFIASDIAVSGGTISNFAGSGVTYTALFTPTANSSTNGLVSVASGVFTDTAGNTNSDGSDINNLVSIGVDTVVPTIAISANKSSLIAGDDTTVTFTLSEASTTFTATDVVASGGTLSNFAGSGTNYTAIFTPAINSSANGVISVASGVFTDIAGNANVDGADTNNNINLIVDTALPTIALSTSKSSLIAGESAILTFVLSEASTTFSISDVTVSGGRLSNFTGSGATYAATFIPTDNSNANGAVSVSSGVFTDSAGNANADGSDANNTLTLLVDTVLPTIALSTSNTNLIEGDTATVTFTLSEASTTFTASDITITGGSISNFLGFGTTYTATFTPTTNSSADGVVRVATGVFTDKAGNLNADGADKNNALNFTRVPTVISETHVLSVIVDKNVLGASAVLLKDLKESFTYTNGFITKHTVEYAGLTFDYTQIDTLITTVTRDAEFTSEFTKEINDYLATELNITYAAAVKLLGLASIDAVILSVAGADGNFVG